MKSLIIPIFFTTLFSYNISQTETKDVWQLTGAWEKSITTTYCYYSLVNTENSTIKKIKTKHVYGLFRQTCPMQPN